MQCFKISAIDGHDGHDDVRIIYHTGGDPLGAIFIHRRGPGIRAWNGTNVCSLGGCRKNDYKKNRESVAQDPDEAALSDGLKLSRGMSYKAWMAKLRLGGGKSVIFEHNFKKHDISLSEFWPHFGALIRQLGYYHTAEDAGTTPEMMAELAQHAPAGLVGGAKEHDPSPWTARGIIKGLDASIDRVFEGHSMRQLSFGIKGVGNVGSRIVEMLINDCHVRKVVIADSKTDRAHALAQKYPSQVYIAHSDDFILRDDIDVYIPCALGGDITEGVVPHIHARLVLGAANNQLATPEAGVLLHKYGIWYAPDFVVNAGGLLAVVELDLLRHDERSLEERIRRVVPENIQSVFDYATQTGKAPSEAAVELAEKRGREMQTVAI